MKNVLKNILLFQNQNHMNNNGGFSCHGMKMFLVEFSNNSTRFVTKTNKHLTSFEYQNGIYNNNNCKITI